MSSFEINEKGIKDFFTNIEEELIPKAAIEEILKIRCPVCGCVAKVKSYSKNNLDFDCCHNELRVKIEQTVK